MSDLERQLGIIIARQDQNATDHAKIFDELKELRSDISKALEFKTSYNASSKNTWSIVTFVMGFTGTVTAVIAILR